MRIIKTQQDIDVLHRAKHKMFILEGIGSNGKSVLIEVIEHLCGKQNVSHVPMNELSQPFARAELVGNRRRLRA